jgi:hypothetical protein
MSYLTDPDFDKKMTELFKCLTEQQQKLEALVDEGPEEHRPEMYFDC